MVGLVYSVSGLLCLLHVVLVLAAQSKFAVLAALELVYWLGLALYLERCGWPREITLRIGVLCLTSWVPWSTAPFENWPIQYTWTIVPIPFLVIHTILAIDVGYALRTAPQLMVDLYGRALWWSGVLCATMFLAPFGLLLSLAGRVLVAFELIFAGIPMLAERFSVVDRHATTP